MPTQGFGRIEPYFQMMQLTPEREPEFLLTRPFVLASANDSARNLTAVMVASNDAESYGRLEEVVIQASGGGEGGATDNLVDGPLQAAERISIYQPVSEYQTLVGRSGSSVQFGNLLILPFGDSLLYLRPVYARQESSGVNTLQRIAVTTGDSVGFGETVDEALADLVDGYEAPETGTEEPTDGGEPSEGGGETPAVDQSTEELLAEADQLFNEADAALEARDLAGYEEKVNEARELLEEALTDLLGPGAVGEGDAADDQSGADASAGGTDGAGAESPTTTVAGET